MFSYRKAGQAGNVTRLMSCTAADLAAWKDDGVATHVAPSWSVHPRTGDQYSCAPRSYGIRVLRTLLVDPPAHRRPVPVRTPCPGSAACALAGATSARQCLLTWRLGVRQVGP